MSFAIADRVRETTNTTGTTSPLNLLGAWPQFQAFIAGVGSGNNCEYTLLSADNVNWEVGLGTVTSGTPNTLSRDTVLASSNVVSGVPQLISLTGTSTVFLTQSAARARATLDAPIVPPPVAASWTQRSFAGTTTLVNVANGVFLQETASQNGDAVRGMTIASPTTPYTIDAIFSLFGPSNGTWGVGLGWTDGTKLQFLAVDMGATALTPKRAVMWSYTNSTTWSASLNNNYYDWSPLNVSARISDDGTNISASLSSDGVTFVSWYTVAKASGFLGASGYTNVGMFLDYNNNGATNMSPAVGMTLKSWWPH